MRSFIKSVRYNGYEVMRRESAFIDLKKIHGKLDDYEITREINESHETNSEILINQLTVLGEYDDNDY